MMENKAPRFCMALEPLPLAPGPGPDLRGRNLTTNVLQCHIQSFIGRRDCLTQKGQSSRKLNTNARWWGQSFQATGDLSWCLCKPHHQGLCIPIDLGPGEKGKSSDWVQLFSKPTTLCELWQGYL